MDTVDRNYVESLIRKAYQESAVAMSMADAYGLADVAEKLRWALDFQRIALAKLATGTNEDGTFGPSHITDTGRELEQAEQHPLGCEACMVKIRRAVERGCRYLDYTCLCDEATQHERERHEPPKG